MEGKDIELLVDSYEKALLWQKRWVPNRRCVKCNDPFELYDIAINDDPPTPGRWRHRNCKDKKGKNNGQEKETQSPNKDGA